MKAYAQQEDTVDLMCWRYYGRTESVLEQVLLANPGLADVGVMLPHGYAVEMPEITDATVRETVQLWD